MPTHARAISEKGPMNADQKLHKTVEELLARGDLDRGAPAYTVAQKILFSGYESLTRQQKVLYGAVIEPLLKKPNPGSRP